MRNLSILLLIPCLAAMTVTASSKWFATNTVNGVTLTGDYEEFPVGGLIEQSIVCELENARPGARVTFDMDGIVLGSTTVDNNGKAHLSRAYHLVPPDANGRPNGPRVNDGSLLTARSGPRTIVAVFQPVP